MSRQSARAETLRDAFQARQPPALERQRGPVLRRGSSRDRIPAILEETKPCTFNPPRDTIAQCPNIAASYARAPRARKARDRSPCLKRMPSLKQGILS